MKPGPEHAADYYNASDVMTFYRECWGGAIHIGRYDRGDESVGDASAAMTDHLISLAGITAGQDVIDIAYGVGGTVGKLAARGCTVTGIDISENEIAVARDRLGSDIASGRVALPTGSMLPYVRNRLFTPMTGCGSSGKFSAF